tara:strand:+ start:35317 stop:35757 length:441 start_codon:yes stop_codon:yes gene_type:complete
MANSLEAKIVVLGSQGVGKTSLVHRYVKNAFTPPTTTSTIGASFLTKRVVDIDTSTVVRLQIWDTAGQERFRSISKLYYRGMSHSHLLTPEHVSISHSAPMFPLHTAKASLFVLIDGSVFLGQTTAQTPWAPRATRVRAQNTAWAS